MKRLIYLILLLFGLSGCKTEQQEVQNPIVVDTDFVLQENYYGGAMQWEPNDRDSMTEEQWDRLFRRVEFMKLGYIRCCIMPYFYCFGYDGTTLYCFGTWIRRKSMPVGMLILVVS